MHSSPLVVVVGMVVSQNMWATVPAQFPAHPCKNTWSSLIPKNLHKYDFKESYKTYAKRLQRNNCFKNWTILVYMAADDHKLMPYAFADLYEMEAGYKNEKSAAGSTLNTDLIVQLDTEGNHDLKRLHLFQTKEPYNSQMSIEDFKKRDIRDVQSPVIAALPENNKISEAERLRDFLNWGVHEYPASHYMVIIWGHGQGWAPAQLPSELAKSRFLNPEDPTLDSLLTPFKTTETHSQNDNDFSNRGFSGGIAFNESKGTYLDIPSLKHSINAVFDKENPIDIYASDACLMQMVEVATEISDVSRFIVGSTQIQNFLGLPYRRLLYEINHASMEPFELAKLIPQLFHQSMTTNGLQGRMAKNGIETVTMSAISSSELNALLLPRLNQLSQSLLNYLREDSLRSIDLQFILQNSPRFEGGAQEIGAFLTLVELLLKRESEKIGEMSDAAEELKNVLNLTREALHRTVVSYALGTRYSHLLGLKALSFWLPVTDDDFQTRFTQFKSSTFYQSKAPNWSTWLQVLFNSNY